MARFPKPTREALLAAADKTVPDVIAPGLRVLFCGINPSLYTAAVGYHFARPGNRFWPALHAAGFTDRVLHPSEQKVMLANGYGITNVVDRATATAEELSPRELAEGGRRLEAKVRRYKPEVLAVLGVTAYRAAFARPKAAVGEQPEAIGPTRIWVLPNPSGLNAHYRLDALARLYREMLEALTASR
ncbi:MAG TPA: G/U mismatch-specific DNA glycosylase [Myxococcaceae bacterium]|nr:G/U mismatch-specific DNA glycosylase [Myxococcaceae bacterium]